MAKVPFKMKGFPTHSVASPLAKATEPKDKSPDDMDKGKTVVKGDEFNIENYQQTEYDYSKMKKSANRGSAAEKLAKRYGGTWTKKTDIHGRVTFRNQDNQSVKEVESKFLTKS